MLRRAAQNFILSSKTHQKTLTRAILTSNRVFVKQVVAEKDNDTVVYSPLPSLVYPDCSIDQYVWKDVNKWSSKTALVSKKASKDEKNLNSNQKNLQLIFYCIRSTVRLADRSPMANFAIAVVLWLFDYSHYSS